MAILLRILVSSRCSGNVESTLLSFIFSTSMFFTSSYFKFDSSHVSFKVCRILPSCLCSFVVFISFESRGVSTVQIKLEDVHFNSVISFPSVLPTSLFFEAFLFSFIWSVKSTSFFRFFSNVWICSSDVLIRLFYNKNLSILNLNDIISFFRSVDFLPCYRSLS